jgi:hypothetical protein
MLSVFVSFSYFDATNNGCGGVSLVVVFVSRLERVLPFTQLTTHWIALLPPPLHDGVSQRSV